jgi:hypothetical protein
MEQQSKGLTRIIAVETAAELTVGTTDGEDLAVLVPAAAAALNLLAGADHDDIVQALKATRVCYGSSPARRTGWLVRCWRTPWASPGPSHSPAATPC